MTDSFQPIVIIDTRKQIPLPIAGSWERATLTSGDYSYRGGEHVFSIERKSLTDLVGSLTTGRALFTRECERLRGYPFARLLIIGDRRDSNKAPPAVPLRRFAMVNSLAAFEAPLRASMPPAVEFAGAEFLHLTLTCQRMNASSDVTRQNARAPSPLSLPSDEAIPLVLVPTSLQSGASGELAPFDAFIPPGEIRAERRGLTARLRAF